MFTQRTDAEAETPIFWPPDAKTVGSLRDKYLIILFSDLMVTHAENA